MKVTISDVARAAKVSRSTVSRVLNDDPRVHPYTRYRVKRSIKELGYRPNAIARMLKQNRSFTIAVLVDQLNSYFSACTLEGIEGFARKNGYNLLLGVSRENEAIEERYMSLFEDRQIEGIVVVRSWVHELHSVFKDSDIPVVLVYCFSHEPDLDCVIPDDYQGAHVATKHLIEHGHTRIGFINGPADWKACTDRLHGYKTALEQVGIEFSQELVRYGGWESLDGYKAAKDLLAGEKPTAIFAANDYIAVGVIEAANEMGMSVPGDLAVVGYDDREPAKYVNPPLTTVRLPLEEMALRASETLIAKIESIRRGGSSRPRDKHQLISVECPLVVRASCGCDYKRHPKSSAELNLLGQSRSVGNANPGLSSSSQ